MRRENLTAERLRALLSYDPDSGDFQRKVATLKAPVGSRAGSVHKNTGYVAIRVDGLRYQAHRLAWLYVYGSWPTDIIDHKNGVSSDNSISNLRLATCLQNQRNKARYRSNKCGYKGVYWNTNTRKWRAHIKFDGRLHHLGLFETPQAAHAAYVAKATEVFGEFARAA